VKGGTLVPWVVSGLAAAVFGWFSRRWPDDWDGVGFVLAVHDYDLSRFRPHFPGYPLYVVLARAVAAIGVSPAHACALVSALGGTLVVAGLCAVVAGRVRAWWISAAALALPVLVATSTRVGADTLALGWFVCAAALALRSTRGLRATGASGVCLGLSLAARPGIAIEVSPVWLACCAFAVCTAVDARDRRIAIRSAGIATVVGGLVAGSWLAWPIARHGWRGFWQLGHTHVVGHFGSWGGTLISDDGPSRGASFVRLLVYHGLGIDGSLLGVLRGCCVIGLALLGAARLGQRPTRFIVAAIVCSGLALFLAQSVGAPRHALVPAVGLALLVAAGLQHLASASRSRAAIALVAGGYLAAWPAIPLLRAQRARPPAAVRAIDAVRNAGDPRDAVIFGGRNARFAELVGVAAFPFTWMGEVDASLERANRVPSQVYVTDEVAFRERARGALRLFTRECSDDLPGRIEHCVTVYRYDWLTRTTPPDQTM